MIRTELASLDAVIVGEAQESFVSNNKNANEKQPGEKEAGTFHYNPGNMSGKKMKVKEVSEQQADAEKTTSHQEQPGPKR
jgi:hypothetical protein